MTMNQQPKAAMDASNSLSEPGALQGARRASGDAPGSADPLKASGPTMEVVPRAKRRVFSSAEKRRILAAADRCTMPGEIGALLRREGVYSSSLSTGRRQREALEMVALTPQKRGPKADLSRVEALAAHGQANGAKRAPARPLGQGHAGDRCPKKVAALLGHILDDNGERI